MDIDDDDAVCHSDEEGDEDRNCQESRLGLTNIPPTSDAIASHSHHAHLSLVHPPPHTGHNHPDCVDSGHVGLLQADVGAAAESLQLSEFDGADADSVNMDAQEELLLSEEMLAAAELDVQSYSSGDIDRALEAGTESDRETQELEILGGG